MTLVRTEEGIQDEQLNMESFPLAAASGGASNFSCAWTGVYNMYNPADRMHVLCRRGFWHVDKAGGSVEYSFKIRY